VFDRIGISLVEAQGKKGAGCCGALRFHLADVAGARDDARRNIDAWWPLLEDGCEGIVVTASGCGVQVRDYAHLLAGDSRYAMKAARIALATRDVAEVLAAEKAALLDCLRASAAAPRRVAFHAPCTLQHGQQIHGIVEDLLAAAGFELTAVANAHLCCGSAGAYSLLQPQISTRLRDDKVAALAAGSPEVIASANIGCITCRAAAPPAALDRADRRASERLSGAVAARLQPAQASRRRTRQEDGLDGPRGRRRFSFQ
jgi:glycolate oxidase iron-sulfur subunit